MFETLYASVVLVPFISTLILGLALFLSYQPSEKLFARISSVSFFIVFMLICVIAGYLRSSEMQSFKFHAGSWFQVGHHHYQLFLIFDRLSLLFAGVSALLVALIARFAEPYLHREKGFFRFYFLLCLFGFGVQLIVLSGTLDLLFVGWEVVGLTSALLIAFFESRANAVKHGMQTFVVYRICDVGLLAALIWLHHVVGNTIFDGVSREMSWLSLPQLPLSFDSVVIGGLLIFAAMGKAAQFPLGGWLPRAMEGPTPSSAIFYGAISVHLGAYLLLRSASLFEAEPWLRFFVIVVGALTALHATFVGRVQTDIKSALAYASMTQVGLIFVEIGLQYYDLALVHILGHAALRSLQILRSPSVLQKHANLEQAMGAILPMKGAHFGRWIPRSIEKALYRHALDRGSLDAWMKVLFIGPFYRMFLRLDQLDTAWINWLEKPKNIFMASQRKKEV